MGGQANCRKMSGGACGIGGRDQALFCRKFESQGNSQRHCFAVQQPVGEATAGLERMAERVAEIEQRALSSLALVPRDDAGLGAAANRNRVLARRTSGKDVLPVLLEPGEERGVAEQPVFGDFGIAGAEFAFRQRVEQCRVSDHQRRLMKGTDEILALQGVDTGLAADGRVDLREQGGGHLHVIEATPNTCRGKARKIADYTATERDAEVAALNVRKEQGLADVLELFPALRTLARRNRDNR